MKVIMKFYNNILRTGFLFYKNSISSLFLLNKISTIRRVINKSIVGLPIPLLKGKLIFISKKELTVDELNSTFNYLYSKSLNSCSATQEV